MRRDERVENLIRQGLPREVRVQWDEACGLQARVDRTQIVSAVQAVIDRGGRYQVGVGVDRGNGSDRFEFLHSFAFDSAGLAVQVVTDVPENEPEIPSITPWVPSAGWSEREHQDLLGLRFVGHPKPKRLVLSDDFPADIHPLRREIPWNLMPPGAEDVAYQLDEVPEGCSVLPVGPFHPALHEPAHFAVFVDGETVKGCDYRGFMVHRGIEKLSQTQLSYGEIPFIAERICGICGSVHATAYAQAVEAAAGIEVSRRARYIRSLMLEMERIHSHLMWIGVLGHVMGFDTLFMHAWRIREPIMWLAERITGNRKTYGMVVVGGVRRDLTPEIRDDVRRVVEKLEDELKRLERDVRVDPAVRKRTVGVGSLSTEETRRWSLIGPVARARGIDIDVRRDFPYAAYDELEFQVPVLSGGDVWSTLEVRLEELKWSIRLMRQVVDGLPDDGPLLVEFAEPIPPGRQAISCVEAPRGECVHYLMTGEENRPARWRVRAPTYANLQGVPSMLLENQLADVPVIIASIDPCFSCTDRVSVIDLRRGGAEVLSRSEFERLAREKR
ncbi:MAG TPA: NADH-quinone oxidoreductase subunit C [Acidobacteriota bacterium]|nr:NADH-quinone oxidoreductase subunit C [Acidobacteriota bacterium]HRR26984.1 NADH-quinone oxidoreductase subunit C [Acidobacteriota bacterium]HRV07632.1 NADH-quinone oxidoreductase subunit C [Acidobacteriota bacterium]